ncbi:phytanoyl-CoA dioxygenase family protein [Streptomyces angustmyceticus]|uniref:phytanoyl-CoA dioxygenase family protein n=1 Tax=Streptomyces angustmyceticus TaxID=285578 RepID=UPI0021B07222|nr:phytanoyl-CoA dioxygenase family protein [Streptomyces angustmyceticus]
MVFTTEHFDDLARKGYCVIENYLDPETVQRLREESEEILSRGAGGTMPPSLFLESVELKKAFFSEKLNELVADLNDKAGPMLLYPNFTVRKGLVVGWHIDDRMLSRPVDRPGDFPSILMFNVFLQDNDTIRGGGVDIVSGSHLLSRDQREELVREHEYTPQDTVHGKAGDLVVFDYRAAHRGTHPQVESDTSRLALQWTFSAGGAVTQDYLTYLRARLTQKIHISDYTSHKAKIFFADLPNITRELIEDSCGTKVFTGGLEYRGLADLAEQGSH